MFKITAFIIIFLLLLCFVVFAQDEAIKFFSSVDKSELSRDDALTFKVTVEGKIEGSSKIELPNLEKDFNILATQQSEEMLWQGVKSNRALVYNITLMPKFAGEFTIGAVKLKVGAKVYTTDAIKITVKPGGIPKKSPWENKQGIENQENSEAVTL